jgi:hypothetical protein
MAATEQNFEKARKLREKIMTLSDENMTSFMVEKIAQAAHWGDDNVRRIFFDQKYPAHLTTTILTQFSVLYAVRGIEKSGNEKFSSLLNLTKEEAKSWIESHKLSMIEGLMENFLSQMEETKEYVGNYSKFETELAPELCDETFVQMELVRMMNSQQTQLRIFLWCVRALDHSSEEDPHYTYFNRMMEYLQDAAGGKDVSFLWKNTTWLDEYVKQDLPTEQDCASIARRLTLVESREVIEEKSLGAEPGYTSPIVMNYRQTIRKQVGKEVAEWIVGKDGPKKYGWSQAEKAPDCSGTYYQDIQRTISSKDVGGCVAKGTRIQLADGTETPVEDISLGQKVLSRHGVVSVTSDELVVTPGIPLFYSVNDQPPFLSAEQAYVIPDGYAALDPDTANEINPFYHVRKIQVGDTVYRLQKRNGKLEELPEKVERINIWCEEEGMVGYDLHFREGTPSYFANGYLCLLNYPEITVKRVKDRLAALLPERKEEVLQVLKGELDVLKDCIGTFAARAVEHMIEEETHDQL